MMKSWTVRFLILASVLLLSLRSAAEIFQGRVIGISDGDSVAVLDASSMQVKIRLMGMDAPERKQAFSKQSRQSLAALLFDRQVTVESSKKDKYGRTVGKILMDGLDVNLEQIKTGMAWHYKQYQDEQPDGDRLLYVQAEEEARAARRGLWMEADPVPPWEWRKVVHHGSDREFHGHENPEMGSPVLHLGNGQDRGETQNVPELRGEMLESQPDLALQERHSGLTRKAADVQAVTEMPEEKTALQPDGKPFKSCDEARNAGAAPVRKGEPGYGPKLDRDEDGIGCES